MNNETGKHAVIFLGFLGSLVHLTWEQVNVGVSIASGLAGFCWACLSIYSWFEKRRQRDAGPNPKDAQQRRKHHRRTLIVFLVLVAALLIAAMAKGEGNENNGTYGTTGLETAVNASSPLRNAWTVRVADDARKLVYDFLSGFSWAGLFTVYLGVKGLRNFTPLGRSAGKIGTLLRLFNLEANALKQNAEQTKQTKEEEKQQ
jgi:hypothetical protein